MGRKLETCSALDHAIIMQRLHPAVLCICLLLIVVDGSQKRLVRLEDNPGTTILTDFSQFLADWQRKPFLIVSSSQSERKRTIIKLKRKFYNFENFVV